jgi:lipoprotein-anchoring transpeptidase ErfK/SrfK
VLLRSLFLLPLAILAPLRADETPVAAPAGDVGQQDVVPDGPPVGSMLELQVELHRRAFSCGSIDGVWGMQTEAALRAFQRAAGILDSGHLDAPTQERLRLTSPVLADYTFTAVDMAGLKPVPGTWLEKSEMTDLGYASAIELAGERFHANPNLLRRLNPNIDWSKVMVGTRIKVPGVERVTVSGTPARVVISLDERELEVVDSISRVIAHFPVSIGRIAEKRPLGDLSVTVVIPNPNYTFDPDVFPESAEGKTLGHNLTIPAGPNNPVGVAWIGLDRPGYGIHGTPEPENVGRTESHGCFRLANWDVLTLVGLVQVGMPVNVEQ